MPRGPVLVAGGGVGGLAAALALQRAGIETLVYERAPERGEEGAGLSIWVSGIVALGRLGVSDAVEAAGATIEGQESRTAEGKVLAHVPVGPMCRTVGLPPPVSIRRSDLLRILHDALAPGTVHAGAVERFDQDAHEVTVHLAGGATARGRVLIGADGINSAVRGQLHPHVRPRYLGYQSLRAVIDFDDRALPRDNLVMSYGRGDRFGFSNVGGTAVWWFGVILAPEATHDRANERKAELLRRFRGFASPVPGLIDATRAETILRHDVRDLVPMASWGTRRVTLLGDAAHAASVAGARGVSLAVEDAVVLAECLAGTEDVVNALRTFEERRRAPTAAAQAWSARIGRRISWRNPVACAIRDLQMRRGAPRMIAAVEAELRRLASEPPRGPV